MLANTAVVAARGLDRRVDVLDLACGDGYLIELCRLRFEVLDDLGLGDADALAARVPSLRDGELNDLVYSTLDLARATSDRLLEQARSELRPTVIWAERDEIEQVIGRTLLWADHYLVPDPLFEAVDRGGLRREELEQPLVELARLRPLVEAGVVVLVPEDLAVVLTNDVVVEAVPASLHASPTGQRSNWTI